VLFPRLTTEKTFDALLKLAQALDDEDEVQHRSEDVYRHVYRVYPTLPSPYYEPTAAA
jgi:hypothetical protein